MLSRCFLACLACLACLVVVRASDVDSGPEKGSKVAAFKVHDCTGDNEGKAIDHVAARKDKVTVYLFVAADKFDRPMNKFMKTLDARLAKDFKDVTATAVWLSGDEDKTKKSLPRVQASVKYEKTTLTVFNGTEGPKDWNINNDAHLTVVLVANGKAAARFGYKSVNDTEVPAVVKELEKLAKMAK